MSEPWHLAGMGGTALKMVNNLIADFDDAEARLLRGTIKEKMGDKEGATEVISSSIYLALKLSSI